MERCNNWVPMEQTKIATCFSCRTLSHVQSSLLSFWPVLVLVIDLGEKAGKHEAYSCNSSRAHSFFLSRSFNKSVYQATLHVTQRPHTVPQYEYETGFIRGMSLITCSLKCYCGVSLFLHHSRTLR